MQSLKKGKPHKPRYYADCEALLIKKLSKTGILILGKRHKLIHGKVFSFYGEVYGFAETAYKTGQFYC